MKCFVLPNGAHYFADVNILAEYDENGTQIGGAIEVPNPPNDDSFFDLISGTWKNPPRTLDEVKENEAGHIDMAAAKRMAAISDVVRRAVVKLALGQAVPPAMLAKLQKNDAIEDARDAAILAVNAATTKAAAKAVQGAIVWP